MMIQYQVREVPRFIVTRYHEHGRSCGSETRGEFSSYEAAYDVAYALCKLEHDQSGEPFDSMNFIYPKPVDDFNEVEPAPDVT